jgi:hypothetical protein
MTLLQRRRFAMMGSRGLKGGAEYDFLTRYRRVRRCRPGIVKRSKRTFCKRMRRLARLEPRVIERDAD